MWADATPTRGRVALLPKALIKQVVQVFGCRDIRAVVSFWASSSVYERSGVSDVDIDSRSMAIISGRTRSPCSELRIPRVTRTLARESSVFEL